MTTKYPLQLFAGVGVELEYMIVDRRTLDVLPIADRLLARVAEEGASEALRGDVDWSNELVMHVLEMKTHGPAPSFEGLESRFQREVREANRLLAEEGAMLLPTAMHPWMDPVAQTRIWPHEQTEIYRAYDRIFGVRGHGWSNLQSAHLNLPFGDDAQFVRLHAAVRAVLPLIPALAASSPVVDGKLNAHVDNRLEFYRRNQLRVPSLAGYVVPETVRSIAEYHERILQRLYDDIEPFDRGHVLRGEWLNSRGAIARFDRGAVEIRLVDLQECPRADLAVLAAIAGVVRALAEERWVDMEYLHGLHEKYMGHILLDAIREGEAAVIEDRAYLAVFGIDRDRVRAGELWAHLVEQTMPEQLLSREGWGEVLTTIREEGTLSRRIMSALGSTPPRDHIDRVYRKLASCLAEGDVFHA